MQYKPETEKIAMMGRPSTPIPKTPLPLSADPQIKHTRKVLMIILGVSLAVYIIILVGKISGMETENSPVITRRSTQSGQCLISIFFYVFGLFVVHRYSSIGLRVFAWLGVIGLISASILLGILFILVIMGFTSIFSTDDTEIKGILTFASVAIIGIGIIIIIVFILQVIIIRLAFKLARLIEANKRLTNEQI